MAMVRENQPEEYFKFGDRIEARLEKMLKQGSDAKQFDLTQYHGISDGESPKLDGVMSTSSSVSGESCT